MKAVKSAIQRAFLQVFAKKLEDKLHILIEAQRVLYAIYQKVFSVKPGI